MCLTNNKEYVTYIHGSEDSTDVDIFYVFDELPSKQECKRFCSADPAENRNIIVRFYDNSEQFVSRRKIKEVMNYLDERMM